MQKLTTLSFQTIRHNVKTFDASPIVGGILVFVSGDVFVDNSTNPIKFAQTFVLKPIDANNPNSFWCEIDMFRLNYA